VKDAHASKGLIGLVREGPGHSDRAGPDQPIEVGQVQGLKPVLLLGYVRSVLRPLQENGLEPVQCFE
jgi:hypothetical protein